MLNYSEGGAEPRRNPPTDGAAPAPGGLVGHLCVVAVLHGVPGEECEMGFAGELLFDKEIVQRILEQFADWSPSISQRSRRPRLAQSRQIKQYERGAFYSMDVFLLVLRLAGLLVSEADWDEV